MNQVELRERVGHRPGAQQRVSDRGEPHARSRRAQQLPQAVAGQAQEQAHDYQRDHPAEGERGERPEAPRGVLLALEDRRDGEHGGKATGQHHHRRAHQERQQQSTGGDDEVRDTKQIEYDEAPALRVVGPPHQCQHDHRSHQADGHVAKRATL